MEDEVIGVRGGVSSMELLGCFPRIQNVTVLTEKVNGVTVWS